MMYAATLGKSQRVRLLRTVKLKAVILQPLWKTQDFCAEARGLLRFLSPSNKRPWGIVEMKWTAPFMKEPQIGK